MVLTIANVLGAVVVQVFGFIVVPSPTDVADPDQVQLVGWIALGAGLPLLIAVGILWGLRGTRPVIESVRHDLEPGERERLTVLQAPIRLTAIIAVLWGVSLIVWFVTSAFLFSVYLAVQTGLATLLGGMTTCAATYLLAERLFRPAVAMAMAMAADTPPLRSGLPGVGARAMLAWALGTGVPVLGLIVTSMAVLSPPGLSTTQVSAGRLAVINIALGGAVLATGLLVTYIAVRATTDPIESVRAGLARVERGDLDVAIPVDDGTEVGRLQAGFNQMAAGLREHERLRDLFGRHVGQDVARAALQRGVELGGELRDVAVLFVDLVGSTRLAATHSPADVVTLLNAFFTVVVEVIGRHGGWVNKFEGDAALAVFGAPLTIDAAPGRALAAARELSVRLRDEVPELRAGIGVSAGPAVAGNIGAEQRFEYTVIGDPVNEAARLSDLAKSIPEGVLAAADVLRAASTTEAAHWRLGDTVTLRGRIEPTRLATPQPADAPHHPPEP